MNGKFWSSGFEDVGKTSSINPHIRTVYSIQQSHLPEGASGESSDVRHRRPQEPDLPVCLEAGRIQRSYSCGGKKTVVFILGLAF